MRLSLAAMVFALCSSLATHAETNTMDNRLHNAARQDDVRTLQQLLGQGAELESRDEALLVR